MGHNQSRADATHSKLFDYLMGAGEQRGRHLEPERLRTLQIDYDLVVHRDWGTGSSFGLLARCGSFHSVHLGRYVPGCTAMRFGPKTGS